jgi:hypothetical protein
VAGRCHATYDHSQYIIWTSGTLIAEATLWQHFLFVLKLRVKTARFDVPGFRNQKNSFLHRRQLLFVLLKLSKDSRSICCTADGVKNKSATRLTRFGIYDQVCIIGGKPHPLAEQRKMGTFLYWKNMEYNYARKNARSGNDLIVAALT